MKKVLVSIILIIFVLAPVGNLLGFDKLGTDHAYALKKRFTQKSFNKQAAALSKEIINDKNDVNDSTQTLNENRMYNANNFATLFEEDTVGLSDDELLAYYIQLVSKFVNREESLDNYFEQDEIDIISNYMSDIQDTNVKIDKLNAKIASYEAQYKSLSQAQSFEAALKVRNNEIKAYNQLIGVINNGIDQEYNLYNDTQTIFDGSSFNDQTQTDNQSSDSYDDSSSEDSYY